MIINYLKMIAMTLFPVAVSILLYLINKKTKFNQLNNKIKQLVYGVIFGFLAILGTEAGVTIDGATINVRDAAPLCAGLFFGAPAGIIAGLIGGIERWFAVLWGAGSYTRLACTIGTIFAGLFGAALRIHLFDNKKPSWYYSLTIGVETEVFHLLLIFVTNMSDVATAFNIVRKCAFPMILCNGVAVMLTSLLLSIINRDKINVQKIEQKQISQSFQRWLFICVAIAFCITNAFTFILQTNLAQNNTQSLLSIYISDVQSDIEDASNANLLKLTNTIAKRIDEANIRDVLSTNQQLQNIQSDDNFLTTLKNEFDVSEISIINFDGIISRTTVDEYHGFDMHKGAQSQEFLVLLTGKREYVQKYQAISNDASISMKYAGSVLKSGGFVQVGYNANRFQRDIDQNVVGITRNRHVGEEGYLIVADSSWNIVSDRNLHEGMNIKNAGWENASISVPTNTVFTQNIFGIDYYCMYTESEGYYIVALLPKSEALFDRNISVYVMSFMELLIFAALFILIYLLIKKLVVENIHKINTKLAEITGGNLNVTVDVRTNEEFASLSDDINSTVLTLKRYIAEAAARIDKELEFAKKIQESTLPSVFPPFPEQTAFDIYAQSTPAKEVGGDFYDFYMLGGNRLAFLIADVSGKGISAAMFMMTSKTLIKSLAEKEIDVSTILTKANNELCENNEADMFVTCWMGILDIASGVVSFSNAGHNPPLIRHKDGKFEYLKDRHGLMLGGFGGLKYKKGEFTFLPGDEIFLYTDGVTEATDAKIELFGDERLQNTLDDQLNTETASTAESVCRTVKNAVDTFVGEAPQFDDITMLSLKFNG